MKKILKIVAILLSLAILLGVGVCFVDAKNAADSLGQFTAEQVVRYTDAAIKNWLSNENYKIVHKVELNSVTVNGQGAVLNENSGISLDLEDTLSFNIPDGEEAYKMVLRYKPLTGLAVDCKLEIVMGEQSYIGFVPVLWADTSDDYSTDRVGNEYNPDQLCVAEYLSEYVYDYRTADKKAIDFKSGNVTLKPVSQQLEIVEILLVCENELQSYSQYKKNGEDADEMIIIEAEKYSLKSDSFIRGAATKNAALEPYNTYRNLINNVAKDSWGTVGQKIIWEFDAPKSGYYKLGFRYLQDSDVNKSVYRNIEIDGITPFKELGEVKFPFSGNSSYANYTVSSDNGDYYIYLEKGHHTIAMKALAGDYAEVYNQVRVLMNEISAFGMALTKLTAGSSDENRTWDMDSYMPDAVDKLKNFAKRIDGIYKKLEKIGGCEPTYASNLTYAADTLRELCEEPNQIPNNTDLINAGDSSANKYLGTVINSLISSGLSLDRIYFYSGNMELPSAESGFVTATTDTLKSFIFSFLADSSADYTSIDKSGDDEELTVWVNRSIQYVQVLQRLIDSDFNSTHDTNIQLSIMPNEQKLILSNATSTNPDVVLGVTTSMPFNLAIRGAAKNLLEYDDFLSFYDEQYNVEALIPFVYGDGVYGACEAYDFQVLFYRKDIMDSLGLQVPDTWDDVKKMMPTLLRNSMNFFIPLSSSGGYKNYNMTTPFLYQNGGTLYSENGVATAIDSQLSVNGFWDMTELYNIYSLDTVVASFYNSFRYGEVPIGVSGFGNYIQMLIAAPELEGLWDIALTPGTRQEDGSILRSQMADLNACMIFENTDKEKEAWEFMKWWLSEPTQTKYALMLQTSYGSEYRWNTANLKTFEQLPYDEAHKKVILEQWECQMENIRHPANYMVEREISNIWNNVVVNSEGLIDAVDESTVLINREIERKLKEFGYIDKNGKIVKDYATNAYEFLMSELGENVK
ncbi:MAG: extracellular solute-binding protein [Ruminococcaceae bacterium]|nr:extracellular solute-binding protein [Oscillospiraceae bacterium]